jgi:hypothetical protein
MTSTLLPVGRLLALASLSALAACESTPTVCDASFLAVPITVLDSLGNPAAQAGIASVLVRTGDTVFSSPVQASAHGTYVILTDQALPRIRHTGDPLDVTVAVPPAQRTVRYVFDSPGGCHVNKVSGPDTLTVP